MSKPYTITKLTGDRESKGGDILDSDGTRLGSIEVLNEDGFQTAASCRRTWRFAAVEVYLLGGDDAVFAAVDGHDRRSAMKAARAWLDARLG